MRLARAAPKPCAEQTAQGIGWRQAKGMGDMAARAGGADDRDDDGADDRADDAVSGEPAAAGRGGAATEGTRPVVALVASAGGLEAVTSVLELLPADFPAAMLVLIHQEPERVSHLPHILEGRCALPVAHADDGQQLESGHVMVAPPGKHLLVTAERRLALVLSGAFPPNRPSADLLLTSMALSLGDQAIVAVLSGSGTDGATGATVVHDFGGWVLTADRASSAEFGMPEAAIGRDSAVNETMPVSDIAGRLVELVAR